MQRAVKKRASEIHDHQLSKSLKWFYTYISSNQCRTSRSSILDKARVLPNRASAHVYKTPNSNFSHLFKVRIRRYPQCGCDAMIAETRRYVGCRRDVVMHRFNDSRVVYSWER